MYTFHGDINTYLTSTRKPTDICITSMRNPTDTRNTVEEQTNSLENDDEDKDGDSEDKDGDSDGKSVGDYDRTNGHKQ